MGTRISMEYLVDLAGRLGLLILKDKHRGRVVYYLAFDDMTHISTFSADRGAIHRALQSAGTLIFGERIR